MTTTITLTHHRATILCVYVCMVRTPDIYFLSKLQVDNMLLLAGVTMQSTGSPTGEVIATQSGWWAPRTEGGA